MQIPTGTEKVDEAEIAEATQLLEESREDAILMVTQLGAGMPMQELGLEERLTNPNTAPAALKEVFGLNPEAQLATNETEGTPGEPGEGKIVITTFGSNEIGLFIFRLDYADGDTNWVLGPQNYAETL